MKSGDLKYFNSNYLNIGPGVLLSFVVLVALIIGGNALLLWQFQRARLQTERLTGGNQQVVAVLRLRESLLWFHQRLDELVRSREAQRVATEAGPLRRTLLEQIQHTRDTLIHLPPETHVDPAFLPTLDAIAIDLSSQVDALTALARTGDWEIMRIRLGNAMTLLETQISVLVKSIEQEANEELSNAAASMRDVQGRIIFLVPTTAISTFFIAAFFGWAIARRIVELRLEERVSERTRIAHDLHDNLLQGVISASMQLHLAVNKLPADSPAMPLLTRVAQIIEQVTDEGRKTIRGYRPSDSENQDLARVFSTVQQGLGPNEHIDFRVTVEGRPRALNPAIFNEVYSIGREALVNSFRHSGASRIEIKLEYSISEFHVLVRDDGRGIDSKVLQSGRIGHWGLPGMRERTDTIGAKLRVFSRAGGGTEVDLTVPGSVAFQGHSSSAPYQWFARLCRRTGAKAEPTHKQWLG